MTRPFVSIPYEVLDLHLDSLRNHALDIELSFTGGNLDGLAPGEIERIAARLGYSPRFTLHAPYMDLSPGGLDEKVRAVTVERFRQIFAVAELLGPRAIVFHSGYEKWKYGHKVDQWLAQSLRTWGEFIPRARALGAVIAVENVFEDDPRPLRLLADEIGSSAFGICFDTGHFNLFAREPLDVWLDILGPHICELHLHDNQGDRDTHGAIGTGGFDFERLFRFLSGREVIRTIETHSEGEVLQSLARVAEL